MKQYEDSSTNMNDYANQARNAVSGEPQQVLIVFDTVLSRKASRFYTADEQEKKNILAELKERGATCFIGDDNSEKSVAKAYQEALAFLEKNTLFDPSSNAEVKTFQEVFANA